MILSLLGQPNSGSNARAIVALFLIGHPAHSLDQIAWPFRHNFAI
jgi:hypothetical protein